MSNILEGKRIFIIEDDVLNLAIFSACLRKSGAIIVEDVFGYGFAHGVAAHISERLPVDLIVLDIMLRRGLNGYDVYNEIRKTPQMADIPIVVVTSLDSETEIPKAKARGLNGFISKPINASEFPGQLASIISGKSVWINSR
ncbi:MAG: response regulator [Chloroflexi bacterium]|nr:response regulator [Chloroflexota bacterium]